MTTNQINYAALLETQRHNRMVEAETAWHNRATEFVAYANYGETVRSNKAREAETKRHNEVAEVVSFGELEEKGRHNRATESIDVMKLWESERHNKVTEGTELLRTMETKRHDIATENETKRNNLVQNQIAKHAEERQTIKTQHDMYMNMITGFSGAMKDLSQSGKNVSEIVSNWLGSAGRIASLGG